MTCLLVITDGRDTVHDAITSASAHLKGEISARVLHYDRHHGEDRSGELRGRYRDFDLIVGDDLGFAGAIRNAWAHLAQLDIDYVFHLEDDFTFNRPVDVDVLAAVMERNQHLTQMALRRQPWNPAEIAAGGVVEQHPDDYTEVTDGASVWLEHRRFWTTNPCIYRASLMERDWPTGPHSEGRFGRALLDEDTSRRSAFWGGRDGGEWVTHIGHRRAGHGY